MNQPKKPPRLYNGALFPAAGDYTIDPVHSFVDFIAQHLVVGQIRGSFHPITGNIKIADDPALFPKMTYKSTGVIPEPRGHLTVEGELTIRDVTQSVSIDSVFIGIVDDPWGNTRVGFYGSAKISRRDFGLMTDLMVETGRLLVGKDIN